ncbi:putative 6-hydroxy-D-nicotine oxidase [Glarea lozoyensis 74030]|uniref:Putative 6-hydroxy-D-nicotine oxidase n=1 Tax=Glarea lozoyensis (strain ATCC 74030 / MF5533) TaxID=1104152 RepID=H0ESV4_GLAL7|nr:putative 6-hydroxy-D-nicotine oxidase [Glarea lozoyensis 74030]
MYSFEASKFLAAELLIVGAITSSVSAQNSSTCAGVATAVALFNQCGAEFSVRGGGHMNFPGSNNIDDGILLAFDQMTSITVNTEASTVDVSPGNRWVDVYQALNATGAYAIGGRLKTIGVAGLALIGGHHYWNNKYGFAMDNVVNYEVVLGNGTQVSANNATNHDLFWALKGGANNFGIVTKFTMKTHQVPLISTTALTYSEEQVPGFITAVVDFVESSEVT